jgi:hypothetical protein
MARRKSLPSEIVPLIEPASSAEALEFVRDLQRHRDLPRNALNILVAEKLADTPLGKLQGIAQRIMMDLGKGPPYDEKGATAPVRRARAKAPAGRKAQPPRGGGKRGA